MNNRATSEPSHFFYARVSTKEQSEFRQIKPDLVPDEHAFFEVASGKNFKREIYKKMKATLIEGDTVHFWSIDRFGRNLVDMLTEIKALKEMKVNVVFIDDNQVIKWDDDDLSKELFFAQLSLFAEYQRKIQLRMMKQGVERAKAADKLLPKEQRKYQGKKNQFNRDKIAALHAAGWSAQDIINDVGCSRASYYRIIAEIKSEKQ